MARAGRKRKPGVEREANGRAKRPTLAQLQGARIAIEDAGKLSVASQPHRRGDMSDMRGTAIGRFIQATKLRIECYDAANEYGATKSRWLAAWGAPRDVREGGSGSGDVPMETVREWKRRIDEMEDAMLRAGGVAGLGWVEEMSVYDRGFVAQSEWACVSRALMALAVGCGLLPTSVLTPREIRVTS